MGASVLLPVAAAAFVSVAAGATAGVLQITDTPLHAEWLADVHENIIVFDRVAVDGFGGYVLSSQRVLGYDLESGAEFAVGSPVARQREPNVHKPYVVWSEMRGQGWDVYGMNLETRQEFLIAGGPGNQDRTDIDGGMVVYRDEVESVVNVYAVDLTAGDRFLVCHDCGLMSSVVGAKGYHGPTVSGDLVVWQDDRFSNEPDIWGWRFSTQQEFPICTHPARQEHPVVSGNVVTWMDWRDGVQTIYARDLTTGEEAALAPSGGDQRWQDIDGDLIVWRDGGVAPQDIRGYDLRAEAGFTHTGDPIRFQTQPAIWEDTVVYRAKGTIGEYDIFAVRLPRLATMASCLTHDDHAEYCLEVGVSGGAGEAVEPRLDGVHKLVLTLDGEAPTQPQLRIRDGSGKLIVGGLAVAGVGAGQVVFGVQSGLPQRVCCRVNIAGVLGEGYVVGLPGDATRDGLVSSLDYAGARAYYGADVQEQNFIYDVSGDHAINSIDGSSIKAHFGYSVADCP